ncbi:hypothetical protein HOY80DRAFT_1081617 [Tuber brumale]|nr:hypothetical protein HOY80DRAFT_1081617 [Tuber brumale]
MSDYNIAILNVDLSNEIAKRVKLEENFNIRGAIESIVYRAENKAETKHSHGIQARIDKMAKLEDFKTALSRTVRDRRLVLSDVEDCVHHVYHELSKHAHGNNGSIVIRHKDHTKNEVAALVAIFKAQAAGPGRIAWREDPPSEEDRPSEEENKRGG